MAPATIAGAALRVQTGRGAGWDRDSIIIAIREWVATYGEPPRAADWNPSSAKWSGQPWRVERYRAGRADGSPWPALNSAKRPFGGSLVAAVVAAGYEPAKPGPRRRAGVDPEQAHRADMSPEGRAMLAAALAQAREAERRIALLESQLERAGDRALRLAAERDGARCRAARPAASPAVKPRPAVKPKLVRERVVDDAAVARARRQAIAAEAKADATMAAAREQVADARMDAAEARTAAKRMASRLERAEATIATLRDERRERKADHAQRRLREPVPAARNGARRLSAAELAELRTSGPAGPAVMAQALAALAAARRTSNPVRMQDALRRVAQAAVAWQERI